MEAGLTPRFEDSDDEDDYASADEADMELHLPTQHQSETKTVTDSWDEVEDDRVGGLEQSADMEMDHDASNPPPLDVPNPAQFTEPPNDTHPSVLSSDAPLATSIPGPRKIRVIVGDAAYTTYRAVLYYVRRVLWGRKICSHITLL